MITIPVAVRRTAVAAGVVASLLVGAASIRAAAGWTSASAPLTLAPVAAESLQVRLADEQARSEALRSDVAALTSQLADLRSAVDAAKTQLATDGSTASDLHGKLTAAQGRLAKLDALIKQAEKQLAATVAAAKARAAAPAPAAPAAPPAGEYGDD
jgi:septal ring factor EnvC (AmiA/AmiB activator)